MQTLLKTIATIQFGCYEQPSDTGTIPYLQAKNFSDNGQFLNQVESFIEDSSKAQENLLQEGDILFTSKGFRVFAALVDKSISKKIASSLFYIIKVDNTKILPQYLVSVLNTHKSIQHFKQLGAGSSIPSIRKSEVLDFSFNLVPMEEQHKIVTLNQLFLKDIEISQNLIQQKHILYNNTITNLINQ
jgi:restriction endonuclease S subunit